MTEKNVDNISKKTEQPKSGPFLAKVVNHLDPSYMGMLEVEVLRPVGNDDKSDGQLHQVKMMSPFWGQTSVDYVGADPNDYNNTQKSYGMWFVPPDPGTTVVVIFINGDPKRGYWIGCVPDEAVNFMVPGIAATEFVVEGGGRMPVAEYNKKITDTVTDATKVKKPKHPFAEILTAQGLLKDDIRGITTSSARREVPSAVYGISTPGPLDKRNGAKRGKTGTKNSPVNNAFVSRLGGSTFVMDDGDDRFLRKGPASKSPPVYVNVDQNETGGDPTIPHNELVRIRTRTGHQILLHNSEDLIYIANAKGTAWIELTSNGKIDIYAADDISMHTVGNFNITADKDINLTSTGGSINLNAKTNFNATATGEWNIKADGAGKLTANGGLHIKTGGESNWQAGGEVSIGGSAVVISGGSIDLNGPAAKAATAAAAAPIAPRVPMQEPWDGHENLHGSKLDYTTKIDPFRKEKPSK